MARNLYRLAFDGNAHTIDVVARFDELAGEPVVLRMAAWTPGSYLVRDYARHVVELGAEDRAGRGLRVDKVDKAAWRVDPAGARDIVVRYRVYAHDLTVRTSHVTRTHAFVNGAPTYLYLPERAGEAAAVDIEAPGWHVATALAGQGGARRAADLDELVDSPIHAGDRPVAAFEAAGRPVELAVWGRAEPGAATLDDLVADTTKIVDTHAALFGGVPYERYTFILMLAAGAYGGLEHRASSALLSSPFAFSTRKKYEELLELVSHEFFHLWNVKRIRPRALGPFDYGAENYTRSLWVVEGVTSYYDRHALRRAGLIPAKRYLEKLGEEWGRLLDIPGRRRQSLEEASFDAWIRHYKPDESTVNSTVSYYLKGGIVALCLDLDVRRRTAGARSLDDVMRRLWREYGARDVGYADEDVRREMERAVDLDLGAFFDRCVRGREDPDLGAALAGAGLVLRPKKEEEGNGRGGWLGVTTRTVDGRLLAAQVLADGPGEAAGIAPGDEIVAVGGFRVDEKGLSDRLAARRPGDEVKVVVATREELREVVATLGEKPTTWEIVPDDEAGEAEKALRAAWLGE